MSVVCRDMKLALYTPPEHVPDSKFVPSQESESLKQLNSLFDLFVVTNCSAHLKWPIGSSHLQSLHFFSTQKLEKCTMVPILKKNSHFFFTISKKFLF